MNYAQSKKINSRKSKLIALFVFPLLAVLFFSGIAAQIIVYVSNSGTKYHSANCSSLRRSKTALTLVDAINAGYEPCAVCEPPAQSISGIRPLYRVNTAGVMSSDEADTAQMMTARVVEHIDGDTIKVRVENYRAGIKAVETIRMLGVDTPETMHPQKPIENMGKEASDYTKLRLLNRNVFLAFDWDLRDHYGRLLAYVYTDTGCFNAELIREGYSFAYTRYAFQFANEFRLLEQNARREKRGLWAR